MGRDGSCKLSGRLRPRTARVSCEFSALSRWIATTDGSALAIASAMAVSSDATTIGRRQALAGQILAAAGRPGQEQARRQDERGHERVLRLDRLFGGLRRGPTQAALDSYHFDLGPGEQPRIVPGRPGASTCGSAATGFSTTLMAKTRTRAAASLRS